ncbi:lung adenoma susceptibility protein 2 [Pyxicephalus adspersus]|uniref:Lung adenoma susceptibility protein 2 n=1 Tax=Pyxicephalus adspersus TaxID=30357 RepID=A0AAV2ZYB5_PYXAD|nr:TPA: hypothetical protein GDO54_014505 [Pyxicephalus adspersus]
MKMARSSSPDSSISISSLLASCSLGSSKGSSSSTSSIEYRDKLYDSATKALEAYIEDYEESLHSPMASTGKINVHAATTLTSTKKKGAANTNVRSKNLSRKRYAACDPDLLSLTTDDLLGFPSDGSLPFSHVSDWKHSKSLKNHYGRDFLHHPTLSSPLTSTLNTRTNQHSLRHNSQSLDPQMVRDDFKVKKNIPLEMDIENHPAYYNNLNSLYLSRGSKVPKRYPRWLTSQKSELGVSGITSIPEVKYPLWIKDFDLLCNSESYSTKNMHTPSKAFLAHEPFRNLQDISTLGSSHSPYADRHGKAAVNSSSCVGEKLYLGPSDLDVLKHLHTSQKNYPNDSPLRKLEAFESLQKLFPDLPENNGSPRTEDVLEAERSWEKIPYSFKSPVPVLCKDEISEELVALSASQPVEDFLKDKVKEESKASSFSGGNHHGPVEALKHMLFNLQAFQQNFTPTQTCKQAEEFQKVYTEADSEAQRADQEVFPVNKSLQKALQHLSRLKELVGDGTTKQDHENKEEM